MNILGIAIPGPGASVALFDNHNILAAIEEEKLSRTNDPHALPQLALASVLSSSGLRLSDIGSIALADRGSASKKNPRKNYNHESTLAHLRQLLAGRRFSRFDHHLCHAASTFYTSDFSRSLILTLDHGSGGNSGLVALGEDDHIKSLHSLSFPNSLGWFYSRVTQLVGLRPHRDEHKLQWLSKDGQSEYRESLRKLFVWNSKGLPALDRKYYCAGADGTGVFSPRLYRELGFPRSAPPADRAIRAALSGSAPLDSLALGPEPTSQEVKSVLDNCKIVYKYPSGEDQLVEETVHHLERGKIVAWCQGRSEFGHRALGNRSLLASPFNEYVLDNVNQFIKHREEFHPFALSVPAERAHEFFDCGPNCRFMASLGDLKNPIAGLERFAFNGAAVRVHTVEKQSNPLFWKLLHKFGESAPAPILVNTSFNLFGEPLVTDPRSAVRSFYCAGVDALAVGPFLVVK